MSAIQPAANQIIEPHKARHVSELSPERQLVFYFQFLYRYAFAYLVFLYASHFGVATGWLSFNGAILLILSHSVATTGCMLVARSRPLARPTQNVQIFFDQCVIAFGMPVDPNPGLPLLFVFYLAFLDVGVRYGYQLYKRQVYSSAVALGIMIFIRAHYTDNGFSLLDAWQVLLFSLVLIYGLQVFWMRERTYRALKQTQERLQLSLEAPGVCTWYSDSPLLAIIPDGNFQRLLGVAPGEFSGQMTEYVALLHPDDREKVVAHYMQFLRSGGSEYDAEHRIASRDGITRTVNVRARAIRDRRGMATSISGVAWDLTEQRHQREALLRMEERYRLATRSAKVGAWVWDIKSGMFEIDESLGDLLGLPPLAYSDAIEVIIHRKDFLAVIHPEDRKGAIEYITQLLESDVTDYSHEYRVLIHGEVRGYHSRGTFFRDADGKAVRVAGVTWDATELIDARKSLEQKTQELERSNKELDDFTYIASHDLKEPLRGISNYVQFMEEDYSSQLDEKGRGMLQRMREQANRMESLIQELLNISRVGRSQLALADADLHEVVQEVLASLEFSINEKNVRILIPKRLPRLPCDRVRAGEVFRNLITNGIKYNDKTDRWLEIGHEGTTTHPVFHVRDNGIGIKPEHYEQVFAMFHRLNPRDTYGGGTGVGMTIAQKIVEMHGGHIWIDSKVGDGTTFYFTLSQGASS